MSNTYIPQKLRDQVHKRAKGKCEYCLIPQAFSYAPYPIDHIIAQKHGGETILTNLALSCTLCNQNKSSDIASIDPNTQSITPLYNPRQNSWHDHFQLTKQGVITPLTPKGRATTNLLKLNQPFRIKERQALILMGIL
ncbi:MAG: HNH endonuclease [Candidatus Latescibacterota bacterium]|jgi:5-methylcytosine-specific restriction endonuclease McrA